ncbi:MAG: hypothetical protein WCG83_02905 [Candidatus Peregrinibacteria bacterium]
MKSLSPLQDTTIARRYGTRTLELKAENKTALQRELGWPMEAKAPIVCFPAGMTDALGGKLMEQTLPGILSQGIQLLILGKGSSEYGALFTKIAQEQSHRVAIFENNDETLGKMFAAADIALFFADPTGTDSLDYALQYGVVPVAPRCKGLEDYNPVQETGDAFLFDKPTPWHCFAALVRALETFKFPFDWRTIERHGMEKKI